MGANLTCPICGQKFQSKPLKTWKFRLYKVSRYECPACGTKFNLYEGPSTFTIPKQKMSKQARGRD